MKIALELASGVTTVVEVEAKEWTETESVFLPVYLTPPLRRFARAGEVTIEGERMLRFVDFNGRN